MQTHLAESHHTAACSILDRVEQRPAALNIMGGLGAAIRAASLQQDIVMTSS